MATTDNKIINGSGLSKLSSQIKSYVNDKTEISVGAVAPTDNKIKLWVDTSATGSTSANEVSFNNANTGLTATNVQLALEEINSDLVGSEQVQEMIDNNLELTSFDGVSPASTRRKKASEISNIANIFTDITFLKDESAIIVEWDLEDITFTGSGFNWIGRLDTNGRYSTIGIENYKITLKKGRYYKMMNFWQVPVDTFYKLAPSMGVGLSYGSSTGSYPLDNGTVAVPIFKNAGTKVYYPTDSDYVFVLAIWDITPITSGGLTEEEVNTLIDNKLTALNGNEVAY